ncbi:hypothetical protein XENOCAPTIV_019011, partial [Xenoophorus captivus]
TVRPRHRSRLYAWGGRPRRRTLVCYIYADSLVLIGVPPSGARSPAQAGSADMLPKVETESLGLTRSYGEQGHLPRNVQ